MEKIIFKKQKDFPFLKRFKKKFPITEQTIFVYKNSIYSNEELPYHLIEHETIHINQQFKFGARKWIKKYLKDKHFRFKQELEAYQAQVKIVKKIEPNRYLFILQHCATDLSSDLYGGIINYQDAYSLLKC